jgi:hypothetical protein
VLKPTANPRVTKYCQPLAKLNSNLNVDATGAGGISFDLPRVSTRGHETKPISGFSRISAKLFLLASAKSSEVNPMLKPEHHTLRRLIIQGSGLAPVQVKNHLG